MVLILILLLVLIVFQSPNAHRLPTVPAWPTTFSYLQDIQVSCQRGFYLENEVFSSSPLRFSSRKDLIGCPHPEYSAFVMSAPCRSTYGFENELVSKS